MVGFFNSSQNKIQSIYDQISDFIYRKIMGVHSLNKGAVEPNLFVGGQYNLRGLLALKAIGITGIINMRMHSPYRENHFLGIKYLHLPTPDHGAPRMEDLIIGARFANDEIKNGGKVFIHCRQGIGRGPTMTIAYLMKKGDSFQTAISKVRKTRSFINLSHAQIIRLKELEKYYSEGGS